MSKCLIKLQDFTLLIGQQYYKSGLIDQVFNNKPKYLPIDEIDKMSAKDQSFLTNFLKHSPIMFWYPKTHLVILVALTEEYHIMIYSPLK